MRELFSIHGFLHSLLKCALPIVACSKLLINENKIEKKYCRQDVGAGDGRSGAYLPARIGRDDDQGTREGEREDPYD